MIHGFLASSFRSFSMMLPFLLLLVLSAWRLQLDHTGVAALNITYDHRGLLFDGNPRILISGSIHYPRSTPEMWPDLIAKAKDGGLNVIQTYVFWNAHEPEPGTYNFEDRLDLVRFLNVVKDAGLFVNLRIGPFISAEWNFGGLPVWLHLQPGVVLRSNNTLFMGSMQKFTSKIVQMMKDENLFAWQGGPIIMAQIENEFGAFDKETAAYAYAMWAANMAVGLDTGVPWIMCKQTDAPDPVINTYNGAYGDTFEPNAPYKPKMWTEAYTGWFQTYGISPVHRSEKQITFSSASFFQTNGSFQNYYMYHGGTNFGRSAGGPFITTTYDYSAPLDEYGLLNQPKWGHLKEFHQALSLCETVLTTGIAPEQISYGPQQNVYIFSNGTDICAAFLSNSDKYSNATIEFKGYQYDLPALSVTILPDCTNVAFVSAQIRVQTNLMQMVPTDLTSLQSLVNSQAYSAASKQVWEWYFEPLGVWGEALVTPNCCLEQLRTTKDKTDYMWYLTSVEISQDQVPSTSESSPVLRISSVGNAAHIFVNGYLTASVAGDYKDRLVGVEQPIKLQSGTNQIAVLSMTVGLQTGVRAGHISDLGIQGSINITGLRDGTLNLSSHSWIHQVGLKGENVSIFSEGGTQSVNWTSASVPPRNNPLIWYKTEFVSPMGDSPIALDLSTMGKGQAWVNGQSIGRFWNRSANNCQSVCSNHGVLNLARCYKDCQQPSQRWYHVPRTWLNSTGNLLVLFEEMGGDPTGVKLVTRSVGAICSSISEDYPPPIELWPKSGKPELRLECDEGQKMSSITFASFGTPVGSCGQFHQGACHAPESANVVTKACAGNSKCAIEVSSSMFGEDPCPTLTKTLSVQAVCSATSSFTK